MIPKNNTSLLVIFLMAIFASLVGARPAAAAGQATFVRTDSTTQGNWQGVYGANGYVLADSNINQPPSYAALTPQSQANWVWTSAGTEVRDLQIPGSKSTRQASCWYTLSSSNFDLDVNITDGNTHQVALYALDWDYRGRAETIQVVDGASGAVLDTRSASNFTTGTYYIWNVSGHVRFNVTLTGGLNAVISAAFFDAVPAVSSSAQFVNSDTTTEGNWMGAYGGDGYNMMGVNPAMPAYATLTPSNDLTWTWAASSTDPRALQTGSGGGRIAATWYSGSSFTIDLNNTDGKTHQVALYAVDWDQASRAETVQVVDAQTSTVLDTRSLFNFSNGIYAVWNISGHVKFNVTRTGGVNAVISGVFFGAGSSASPSAPTITSTVSNTSSSSNSSSSSNNGSTSSSNSGSSTTSTASLPSGLVLHWTFDTANISSTTVTDTSNNNGSGTINGNPSVVSGKVNQALSFNGVNSYVSMNAYSDIATGFYNNITLSAWIKTTNASRTESIISKFSASGSAAGYLFKTDAAGHLEFSAGGADVSAYPGGGVDMATINDGQWHHVAVVVTMGQGIQFYVDGTPTSSTKMSLFGGGDNWSNLEVASSSYTPYAQYFTGGIDDVQVYSRALSSTEIGTIFSIAGGQASAPVTQTQTVTAQTAAAAAQGTLTLSPSSFSFGSVNIGTTASQTFTVSNSGIGSVTLSNVSVSGTGLSATGVSAGAILAPGQSATLSVTYTPASAVALNGSVAFASNASNASASLTLTGTGVQPPPVQNVVVLNWQASSSSGVIGYDVYRSNVSGGPYALVTSNPVSTTSYADSTGQAGQTYYYVVTSVDSADVQSSYSNAVSITVP